MPLRYDRTAVIYDQPEKNMNMRTLLRTLRLASLALAVVPATPFAQGYPQKTIRFVVPFPPGGATDALARILGERMSDAWKQPVLIDNRGGAGGNIAAELVAKSPADGYTIIVVGMSHAANLALYSRLAYHPVRDFAPVTQAVAMNMLKGVYGTDYGLVMAGTLCSIAPIMCLFLLLQKEFISGLTSGAVKG
jgi:hypothetical protein